jgi:hypothetical protein
MALAESAHAYVIRNLPYDRNDPEVAAVLKAKSPRELLAYYLNWKERQIPPAPRQEFRVSYLRRKSGRLSAIGRNRADH